MGTPIPIRLLLSPRAASSVSPLIIGTLPRIAKTPKIIHLRSDKCAKRLEFLSPTNLRSKNYVETSPLTKGRTHIYERKQNSQVGPSHGNKKILEINTPERAELLKYGIQNKSVLHVLGSGTFGTVVEGKYKDEIVAVKVIQHSSKIRELNALYLKHENVVKTIDVMFRKNEKYCLVVMEYWGGSRSLQNILDDGSICINSKLNIKYVLDICEGLHYCHNKEILHLDLKPSNILVCMDNVCKLCDFGNSMKYTEEDVYQHKGTIKYTAPEILQGKVPTTKSDVYSLGISMWQIRYRETPFKTEANNEVVIYKVVKFGLRPCSPYIIHDDYSNLCSECWHANPENRPCIPEIIIRLKNM